MCSRDLRSEMESIHAIIVGTVVIVGILAFSLWVLLREG
jgi:hypothetical protein